MSTDYSLPVVRNSYLFADASAGYCALRLHKREFNTGCDHLRTVTATVTNQGRASVSVIFKAVADNHVSTAVRSNVSNQIDLVPGGRAAVTFDTTQPYLELWGINGAAAVRIDLSTKIAFDIMPFDRSDSTADAKLWQMSNAYTLSINVGIDRYATAYTGTTWSWTLPAQTFAYGGGVPTYSFVNLPAWLTAAGSTISGTPVATDRGSATITVVATLHGLTAEQTLVINTVYVNKAPVVTAAPAASVVNVGTTLNRSLDFTSIFSDDGIDTLAYAVTNAPAWLTNTNGHLTGTPGNDDIGVAILTLTATDDGGLSASTTLSLTVQNPAPVVGTALSAQTATTGTAFVYTLPDTAFTDTDTLTYTTSLLPDWLTFNATLKRFSGTPDLSDLGTASITITATDTLAQTATQTLSITINEA